MYIYKMSPFLLLLLLLFNSYLVGTSLGQLQVGFYAKSCPNVEAIVGGVVREAAASDANTAAVLLRLHFHVCFVEGCDGSILIDNGAERDEKNAFGHQGVRGFDIVERVKAELGPCALELFLARIMLLWLLEKPYFWQKGRRMRWKQGGEMVWFPMWNNRQIICLMLLDSYFAPSFRPSL